MSPPAPTTRFDYFFDLVPEIRDMIISQLVLSPEPIPLAPQPSPSRYPIPLPKDLFLSHPLIYARASTLFYDKNTFTLDLASCPRWALKGPSASPSAAGQDGMQDGNNNNNNNNNSDEQDGQPLPLNSPYNAQSRTLKQGPARTSIHHIPILRNERARRRIRRLDFLPDRLGLVFERSICPALKDMVLNGSLRHLKIALYPTGKDRVLYRTMEAVRLSNANANANANAGAGAGAGAGGFDLSSLDLSVVGPGPVLSASRGPPDAIQRQADKQYANSAAFGALLKLLADPDLETAELWVPPVHRAIFCDFHGEDAACHFDAGGAGRRGGWRLVEVDWRGLAARYLGGSEHELHIVRVGG